MNRTDPRIAFFDALAPQWDRQEPSAQAVTACLLRCAPLLALKPGQTLLEVGCGTGKATGWLAAQVAPGRVTAVDFASQMIARAKGKDIDAEFACLDVCRDSLDRERYDVILCLHSFPHFRDQAAALDNFAHALMGGGRLIVMHMAGSEHINQFHANMEGPVKGDVLPVGADWIPLLASAGMQQTRLIDREDLFFLEAVRLDRRL